MPASLLVRVLVTVPTAVLLGQAPDAAKDTEQRTVPLEELVEILLSKNPRIRAAEYRHDAATKRPSQAGTLPDPKLTFTNFGVGHPFSRLSASNFAYQAFGFSQEVPYPGKLALAGEEARREAESERERYRATVLDLISQLKAAYYDWFYLTKAIEITQKNRDLLDRLERIARARYAVGKGIQQDVLKAQVEESGLAQQLEVLAQRKATVEARIGALLNSDVPFGRPEEIRHSPLAVSLEELLASIHRDAPRLLVEEAMLESRAVGVERARKEYRPDFNFNFQWQKTGSPFPDYYMAAAEVRVPLYFWRKQRPGVEEAAARLRESRQNYLATRQELVFTIKDLYLTAKTSERLLALYQSGIIPQSSLSLESALAGYEVGNVDFLTLIDNFSTLLTYETQYYEELARHEQALARLEAVLTTPLTRR